MRGGGGPGTPGAGTGPQYRQPLTGGAPPPQPPGTQAPGVVPPVLPTGPGEYTRVVSATPAPQESPAGTPPAQAEPESTPGRKRSDWIVLSVILAVVLIGAALLVFFVLRTGDGETPPPEPEAQEVSLYSAGRMITSSSFAFGNAEGT